MLCIRLSACFTLTFSLFAETPSAVVRMPFPIAPADVTSRAVGTTYFEPSTGTLSTKTAEGLVRRIRLPVAPRSDLDSDVSSIPRPDGGASYSYTYTVTDRDPGRGGVNLVFYLPGSDASRLVEARTWRLAISESDLPDSFSMVHLGRLQRLAFRRSGIPQQAPTIRIQSDRRPGFLEVSLAGVMADSAEMESEKVQRFLEESGTALRTVVVAPLFAKPAGDREIAANLHYGVSSLVHRGVLGADSLYVRRLLSSLSATVESGVAGLTEIQALQPVTTQERRIANHAVIAFRGGVK